MHRQRLNENHKRRLASLSPASSPKLSGGSDMRNNGSGSFADSRGRGLGESTLGQWRSRVHLPAVVKADTQDDREGCVDSAGIASLAVTRPEVHRALNDWVRGYCVSLSLAAVKGQPQRRLISWAWQRWRWNFEAGYDPLDAAFEAAFRNYPNSSDGTVLTVQKRPAPDRDEQVMDTAVVACA